MSTLAEAAEIIRRKEESARMSLSITPTAMRRVAAAVEMYARNRGLCGDAVRRCQDRAMRALREGEGQEAAIVAGKDLALRVSGFRA